MKKSAAIKCLVTICFIFLSALQVVADDDLAGKVAVRFKRVTSNTQIQRGYRTSNCILIVAANDSYALMSDNETNEIYSKEIVKSSDGDIIYYVPESDIFSEAFEINDECNAIFNANRFNLVLNSTGVLFLDDDGDIGIKTNGQNSTVSYSTGVGNKKKTYYLRYNSDTKKFISSSSETSGENVALYVMDFFDIDFAADCEFNADSESVTIECRYTYNFQRIIKGAYIANEGAPVSEAEMSKAENQIQDVQTIDNTFRFTVPLASEDEAFIRPDVLWVRFIAKQLNTADGYDYGYTETSEILRFDLSGLPLAEGYVIPDKLEEMAPETLVDFRRADNVKIYYTLDGTDPLQARTSMNVSDIMRAPAVTTTAYDLDARPLTVQDVRDNKVVCRATAVGSLPSASFALTAGGNNPTTSHIELSATTTPEPRPEYYTLTGLPVAPPLTPGLYIKLIPGHHAQKILIR